MLNVKLNLKYSNISEKEIIKYAEEVKKIHENLHNRAEDKKDFVGWLELPTKYDKKEFEKVKKAAEKIQSDSEILVVIGIGGSYLGARAVIEALSSSFYNMQTLKKKEKPH